MVLIIANRKQKYSNKIIKSIKSELEKEKIKIVQNILSKYLGKI